MDACLGCLSGSLKKTGTNLVAYSGNDVLSRYPSHDQLQVIYSTYLTSILQRQLSKHPVWSHKSKVSALASSMVQVYEQVRSKFTVDDYSHYLFTPRDLTRWVLSLLRYDLAGGQKDTSGDEVLVVWSYEAHRLFRDRLVGEETMAKFDSILMTVVRNDWSANIVDRLKGALTSKRFVFCFDLCTWYHGPSVAIDTDTDRYVV